MIRLIFQRHYNLIAITLIVLLGSLAWSNANSFIWRDEWIYLSFYHNKDFSFFNGNLAFEIKPLFQYVLYTEFFLAKAHFEFYQAVNVLLLILMAVCFYKTSLLFSISISTALPFTLFFLLHPIHFVNAFWIFQQCELLHLACFMACIYYFKSYLDSNRIKALLLFTFFLFIQNYFFPNGVFFPLLFFITYILSKKNEKKSAFFFFLIGLVFAVHLTHAFYFQSKMPLGDGLFSHFIQKVSYGIKLLSTSIWRIIIPNFDPQDSLPLNLITVLLFVSLHALIYKRLDKSSKSMLAFCSLSILFSSIILVLTRFNQVEIHYYYTALHLPFLFMILAISANHFLNFKKRPLQLAAALAIVLLLVVDYKGKMIFRSRNIANKHQMEIALKTRAYVPMDDPFFSEDGHRFFTVDRYSQSESAVILYEELSQ